jgi:hypothetical protein
LLLQAEKEIGFLFKNCIFKMEIKLDRQGPRPLPYLTFASFLTPLVSHFSLPLKVLSSHKRGASYTIADVLKVHSEGYSDA